MDCRPCRSPISPAVGEHRLRPHRNAAPATIELYVDGMYIVAHQQRGWPKALLASKRGRGRPVLTKPDLGRPALWRRLVAWLRGARRSSTGPASLRQQEPSNVVSLKLV
jgi:hypothetical protein